MCLNRARLHLDAGRGHFDNLPVKDFFSLRDATYRAEGDLEYDISARILDHSVADLQLLSFDVPNQADDVAKLRVAQSFISLFDSIFKECVRSNYGLTFI